MKQIKANELTEKTKHSMKTRILTAIIGLLVVVPLICLGDWFLFALLVVVTGVAVYEIVHAIKPGYHIWLYIVTALTGVLVTFWPLFDHFMVKQTFESHIFTMFGSLIIPFSATFVYAAILLFASVVDKKMSVSDAFSLFGLSTIVFLGLQALLYIRFIPSYATPSWVVSEIDRSPFINFYDNFASASLFAYILIGTFFTDIGAYFVGVFFGKHKINERISPNKTVEGFIGGIVISAIVSMVFGFVLAAVNRPMLNMFDWKHFYNIVIVSVLMPLFATLGDFAFSAIKRHYAIKDYGFILPGHGGVLDRLDSIIFAFIAASCYVEIFIKYVEVVA